MAENIEMSTVDTALPRYFNGFDMNVLIRKMDEQEPLTDEEWCAIGEAQKIYYGKQDKKNRESWENWKKEHPEETYIKCIDPKRITKHEI